MSKILINLTRLFISTIIGVICAGITSRGIESSLDTTLSDNTNTLLCLVWIALFFFLFVSSAKRREKERLEKLPDITPVKIEVLGNNQAFNTSFVSGITYNKTQYTCRITYQSGRVEVTKVDGNYLNKYATLIKT